MLLGPGLLFLSAIACLVLAIGGADTEGGVVWPITWLGLGLVCVVLGFYLIRQKPR